jgi:hypothetical protein
LEASAAIAAAFRLQHETEAAQAAGERFSREIMELEAALAQQRMPPAAPFAKTRAAQLKDAQAYYSGLTSILKSACEPDTAAAPSVHGISAGASVRR